MDVSFHHIRKLSTQLRKSDKGYIRSITVFDSKGSMVKLYFFAEDLESLNINQEKQSDGNSPNQN